MRRQNVSCILCDHHKYCLVNVTICVVVKMGGYMQSHFHVKPNCVSVMLSCGLAGVLRVACTVASSAMKLKTQQVIIDTHTSVSIYYFNTTKYLSATLTTAVISGHYSTPFSTTNWVRVLIDVPLVNLLVPTT